MLIFSAVFIWSAINPKDYFTWMLEVLPSIVVLATQLFTYQRFTLIHCIILMVGGHYTYAEVPLFDNLFGMVRNNYDKLGHLAQGFVPAMVAREILIRKQVVQGRWWLVIFVISFCLGFSAFYELIEWWVALLSCTGAEAFLGTQGYEWDTQADMAFALLGAVMALVTLSRWHNKQLLSKP